MAELVDVGGYRLAISVTGSGSPPVVFVSGLTGDASEWHGVQAAVRVSTTLVTYDRPALGGSDPLPAALAHIPRSAGWAAGQLRALLGQAGVPSPRVLAGHSIGGLIVEAYAARWPAECTGLVLVDPADPRANLSLGEPLLVTIDDDAGGIRFATLACQEERRRFPSPPAIPVAVATAAVGSWSRVTDPLKPPDADERWQQFQKEWAARMNAAHVVAHSAGHCVHIEAPDLVARLVDAVVGAARNGTVGVHLDPAAVDEAGGRLVTKVDL